MIPRGGEDPVLIAFVVVAVLGVGGEDAVVNRAGERGPFGGGGGFAVERVGGDAEAGHGNEGVVLRVGVGAAGFGGEALVHELGVAGEAFAVAFAVGGGEVVVEQVVGDAHGVEEMAGGEVGVGLGEAVAPDVVGDGGVHELAGAGEHFGVALDGVGEGAFGDGEGDVVLGTACFGRGRGRLVAINPESGEVGAPLCGVGAVKFFAEGVDFGGREIDAGMDAGELGADGGAEGSHLVREGCAFDFAVGVGGAEGFVGGLGERGEGDGEGEGGGEKADVEAHGEQYPWGSRLSCGATTARILCYR